MILLTPNDFERIKEIACKLQEFRLVSGPADDAGPLRITIEDMTPSIKSKENDNGNK